MTKMKQGAGFLGSSLLFLAFISLMCVSHAHAFKEGAQSCQKCHTLSEKEVVPILSKAGAQDPKVLTIQIGPIKGLWEVAFESKGQRFIAYVDFSKRYITPGPLIDYAAGVDKTRERIEGLNKDRRVSLAAIGLNEALLLGKADARTKIIVFLDPD